jgi:hypothetical protein
LLGGGFVEEGSGPLVLAVGALSVLGLLGGFSRLSRFASLKA